MPTTYAEITSDSVHSAIALLTHNLVHIRDTTGEFLMPLADGRVIDTKGWNDWEWTHGIGLYGLYKQYQLTDSQATLGIIEDWFAARFSAGGTTKNINTMAAMLTLACLYEDPTTRRRTYLPVLEAWAEWAMWELARTAYGGMQHVTYLAAHTEQLWDDTLMMTVLPLAKIGQVLGRPAYVEEAKRQFLLHAHYLSDVRTGLWFHGWTFADGGHHFAGARWARGNAWVTMVIPEFVELLDLPAGDALRAHLLATLEAQCRALKRYQDASGMWRTLLDQTDEASYVEASATAGFAYGILKAVRLRYLGPEYAEVAVRAVRAVMARIDDRGELRDTSFGTAMGDSLQFYKDIPRTSMPYGQAMAIMALGEFLRKFL